MDLETEIGSEWSERTGPDGRRYYVWGDFAETGTDLVRLSTAPGAAVTPRRPPPPAQPSRMLRPSEQLARGLRPKGGATLRRRNEPALGSDPEWEQLAIDVVALEQYE